MTGETKQHDFLTGAACTMSTGWASLAGTCASVVSAFPFAPHQPSLARPYRRLLLPWSGWDCRGSCGDPWPAPTSSRTCWGRSGASAATSSAGATPRWPCAGPPPPCSRPPRASAGSRRKANSHSCAPPSSPTSGSPPGHPRLPKAHMPHSLHHRHAEHAFQQRSGHPQVSSGIGCCPAASPCCRRPPFRRTATRRRGTASRRRSAR
jgi:hypothetical protein